MHGANMRTMVRVIQPTNAQIFVPKLMIVIGEMTWDALVLCWRFLSDAGSPRPAPDLISFARSVSDCFWVRCHGGLGCEWGYRKESKRECKKKGERETRETLLATHRKAVANRGLELNQTEKEVGRNRGTVKAASAPVLFWMVDTGEKEAELVLLHDVRIRKANEVRRYETIPSKLRRGERCRQ